MHRDPDYVSQHKKENTSGAHGGKKQLDAMQCCVKHGIRDQCISHSTAEDLNQYIIIILLSIQNSNLAKSVIKI